MRARSRAHGRARKLLPAGIPRHERVRIRHFLREELSKSPEMVDGDTRSRENNLSRGIQLSRALVKHSQSLGNESEAETATESRRVEASSKTRA